MTKNSKIVLYLFLLFVLLTTNIIISQDKYLEKDIYGKWLEIWKPRNDTALYEYYSDGNGKSLYKDLVEDFKYFIVRTANNKFTVVSYYYKSSEKGNYEEPYLFLEEIEFVSKYELKKFPKVRAAFTGLDIENSERVYTLYKIKE